MIERYEYDPKSTQKIIIKKNNMDHIIVSPTISPHRSTFLLPEKTSPITTTKSQKFLLRGTHEDWVPHSINDEPLETISNEGNPSLVWFQKGILHRTTGPAIVTYYKTYGIFKPTAWYKNGKIINIGIISKLIANHDLNPDPMKWSDDEKTIVMLAL